MTHNPVDTDDHSAAGLLRTAAELTALADRWLVAAEKALPEDAPLFAAVDTVNAITHLRKAAEKIERAEIALNADNPHPVDPTGPLTVGTIPDEDLDRLIEATIPAADLDAVQHQCGCGCGTVVQKWDDVCPQTLAQIINRSLDHLDRAVADAARLGAPLSGLRHGDARAAAVAVDARRRFSDVPGSGD